MDDELSKKLSDQEKKEDEIRPLRTFQDDVAQLVENQQLSTAKMVLAEQKRKEQQLQEVEEQAIKQNRSALFKIGVATFLIIIGVGSVIGAYKYNLLPKQITNLIKSNNPNPGLLQEQKIIKISIAKKKDFEVKSEIIEKISKIETNQASQVIGFQITKPETITDVDGKTKEIESDITSRDFFRILESTANDRLIRSLDDNFLLGVYTGNENTPFLILRSKDLDLSFSEIYQWEENMYNDLDEILQLKEIVPDFIEIEVPATTTQPVTDEGINSDLATSTKEIATTTIQRIENPEPKFNPKTFQDLVLLNRDVRAIIDESGEIILMYSFIDNENILFIKNKVIFEEIVNKLSARRLVR